MSDKNFASFGDLEDILPSYAQDIKGRLEKVTAMPSNPSDKETVLFTGTSQYKKGGIYEYAQGVEIPLFAWTESTTTIFTEIETPSAGDSVYDGEDVEIGMIESVGTGEITVDTTEYARDSESDTTIIQGRGWNLISTAEIEVDDSLDSTSENPLKNKVIASALGAKQPIQLVSAITLESHAYDTVPTVLSALATRLEDTYKKNEVDTELDDKVDKVTGKGLSTEDYTTEEKTKLEGIESGAEVNVQADWNTTTTTDDSYIKNKPDIYLKSETYNRTEVDAKVAGLLNPMGTVAFANLPTLATANVGDMYNVSDQFVTTSDFEEGAGEIIPAGSNVYKTTGGKWDVLAGSPVTGVKGDKESTYRKGNVNITPANIGAYTSGQVDTILSGKQNIILSNPMVLESHSYNKTETALGALAARLEATYTTTETDELLDGKADKSEVLSRDDYNLLEITAESKTINGISYTIDKVAGTVTANGTATADAYIIVATLAYEDAVGKIYSASPNGGSASTYYGFIALFASSWLANYSEYGTGLTVPVNERATTVRFEVMIRSGQTVSNLVFKPMLTKPEYKGMPFKPYKTPILRGTIDSVDDYLDYDSDIVGVEVDMEAKTVTRIAGAVGKSAGRDFDSINAFGGRKRCNLADDGTVNAYYGGSGYAEDGSNGQVMVEQPKFYYKVVPLKVDKSSGKGWILRKARYYVSDKPREGFKIHPEFVRSGKVKEKVYHSAFEGSLYDVSASAYITDDAQVADFSADKLSSIANAKPISGLSQNLTRANTRKLAENRGLGWEQLTVQVASATQLLMLIEYATFNMQSALSAGNSAKTDDGSSNMAENTGATSSLGNASGEVTNSNGIKMFSYRGEENVYANIWKWMDGLNKYDQTVYIADHSFVDDTKDGYTDAGITACNANGYIKAFCYSEDFDWLFIPAEIGGDSALPVGDYYWYAAGWRVALLGGSWADGASDGAFCLSLDGASSGRSRNIVGRLCYIPDTDESSDKAKTNEELTEIAQVINDDMSSVSSYVASSRSAVYYSYAAQTAYINLFCEGFPSGSNVNLMTLDITPARTTTFPVIYRNSTDSEFLKAGTGTITTDGIVRLNRPPEGANNCVINTTARILV